MLYYWSIGFGFVVCRVFLFSIFSIVCLYVCLFENSFSLYHRCALSVWSLRWKKKSFYYFLVILIWFLFFHYCNMYLLFCIIWVPIVNLTLFMFNTIEMKRTNITGMYLLQYFCESRLCLAVLWKMVLYTCTRNCTGRVET